MWVCIVSVSICQTSVHYCFTGHQNITIYFGSLCSFCLCAWTSPYGNKKSKVSYIPVLIELVGVQRLQQGSCSLSWGLNPKHLVDWQSHLLISTSCSTWWRILGFLNEVSNNLPKWLKKKSTTAMTAELMTLAQKVSSTYDLGKYQLAGAGPEPLIITASLLHVL